MRGKEDAHDYRYFPEPDLPPLVVAPDRVEAVRAALPELPRAIRRRLVEDHGLSTYDAAVLTGEPALVRWFDAAVAAHPNAKALCNWLTTELLGRVPVSALAACPVTPERLARLVALIDDQTISGKIAKTIFEKMLLSGETPDAIIDAEGLRQVTDTGAIEATVRAVVAANPAQVAQFRAGKTTVRGFFIGQIMRQSGGKLNPALVNEILDRLLAQATDQET
jgi:aspartyl-tRNA(Asn)/glutamyl-tRNA(Gln) amidotransferase subunit B